MESLLARMQDQIHTWERAQDRRTIFLSCYTLMTRNVYRALHEEQFGDRPWVGTLMERFAGYYFDALDAYEARSPHTPAVWTAAHDHARDPGASGVASLLLGVNAHINYDLVLVTAELLRPEWSTLSPAERQSRRADYDRVNRIIAETVDTVQDEVLERHNPAMQIVDACCLRLDEWWTGRLLASWRSDVWRQAVELVEAAEPRVEAECHERVSLAAMRRTQLLLKGDRLSARAFGYPQRWLDRLRLA